MLDGLEHRGLRHPGADGQIRDANGAFLSVLRLSRAKVEEGSARWERHILPERQDALASLDAAPLCETELVRDDSTRVSVILGAARDPSDGRVTVLVLDQTERVRAERERQGLLAREQAALAEAQQASCAKDRFLAVLSHELRNPLAPIASGVQLLQRMVTDPRARGPLAILERNVRLEARLVDDLLDLSRITRGMLAVVREPILLNRPLEDTLAAEIDDFARAGIKLESVLEPELWAEADPGRVSQILLNLLSNARKLTPRGGWVRVTLMRAGTCARLIVEDGGKGIAPEVLPLLFTPFSKSSADGGTSAGLGIGLSIVRALAELHGGRTWAESDGLGRGSRFFVEFPLRVLLAAPSFERSATLGKGKLLLVEDNADAREITAMSLTDMGFSVQAFDCAEAALEALASFEPDLMVADIGLPGMDGCALLVRARRLPHLRGLPALAATAYGRPEDARRIRQAGFDGHFVKPFDLKELAERINELIAEKHALSPAPTSLP